MNFHERLQKAIHDVPDFPEPGITFKDITGIWHDPELVRECVKRLADPFKGKDITKIIGIESRGFLMGPMLAQELNCSFVTVRKKGKLPRETLNVSYELEYGNATIEAHQDAIEADDKVLIHDDLLATGGTAAAAAHLTSLLGGKTVGFCFIIRLLSLQGTKKLTSFSPNIITLLDY
jgi:adenine phosphoribosyltransferase